MGSNCQSVIASASLAGTIQRRIAAGEQRPFQTFTRRSVVSYLEVMKLSNERALLSIERGLRIPMGPIL